MDGRLLIFVVVITLGCGSQSDEKEKSTSTNDSHEIKVSPYVEPQLDTIEFVLNIDSLIEYQPVVSDDSLCIEWKMPQKDELVQIFSTLKISNSIEWNMCYGDWSCGVEGYFYQKGNKYYYF